MSILCRLGYHRRLGRSVRSISGGYHGFCRDCGIGMTKPWTKRWRAATTEETLERQRDAERSAAMRAEAAADPESPQPWQSGDRDRRKITRVKVEPPAATNVNRGMFPKTHRRKLEEADIRRRAIDLAYYLIRDHGDGAEEALAERLRQTGLTSSDRKRLKLTQIELSERRKRDRNAKAAPDPAGA